jgi:hypothetical protein
MIGNTFRSFTLIATIPLFFTSAFASPAPEHSSLEARQISALPTCLAIQSAISSASSMGWPCMFSTRIFAPRAHNPSTVTGQYFSDIKHWASSSSDLAACSVQPGSADDLSKIVGCTCCQYGLCADDICATQIKILGQRKTKFAVRQVTNRLLKVLTCSVLEGQRRRTHWQQRF